MWSRLVPCGCTFVRFGSFAALTLLLIGGTPTGFTLGGTWIEFSLDGEGAIADVMIHWVEGDLKGVPHRAK